MNLAAESAIRKMWATRPGHALIRAIREFAPLRPLLRRVSSYRVPYKDFAEARGIATPKPNGYEQCRPQIYIWDAQRTQPGEYPVLFWLQQVLPCASRLFDYGGNLGVLYYAYSRLMPMPPKLTWTVCDIDPFIPEGRKMAAERGVDQLQFTYDFEDGDGAEIFLVSGSLHFIETPISTQLARLKRPPQHLFINRIPLTDGPETVTLQDIVEGFLPCVIRNRDEFVQSVEQAGYRLHDSWNILEKQCALPLYPDRSAYWYSGFYFRLDSARMSERR